MKKRRIKKKREQNRRVQKEIELGFREKQNDFFNFRQNNEKSKGNRHKGNQTFP